MIRKIMLENFRGVKNAEYTINSKIQAFLGATGAGKSSILRAIETVLVNPRTSGDIRMNGSDTCKISLNFDHSSYQLVRKKSGTGAANQFYINDKKASYKAIRDDFCYHYHVNMDEVKKIVSINDLKELSGAEFYKFLMSHIPDETSLPIILSLLPEEEKEEQEYIASLFPREGKFPSSMVNDKYEELRDQIRLKKREVRTLTAKTTDLVVRPDEKKEELQKQLEEINKKIILQTEQYKKMEERKRIEKDNLIYQNQIDSLNTIIRDNTAVEPDEEEWKESQKYKKEYEEELKKQLPICSLLESNIATMSQTLEQLNSSICPISQKLVCNTDKSGIKKELEDLIEKNITQLNTQKEAIAYIEEELKYLENYFAEYQKNQSKYLEKQKHKTKVESLKSLIRPVEKEEEIKSEDWEEKKKYLESKLAKWQLFETFEENVKLLEKEKKELAFLQKICDYLAPKNKIAASIMEYYLSVFNDILEEMCISLDIDLTIFLTYEKGVQIQFKRNGIERSVSDASRGEELLIYFIIAHMINQLSGFPMIFVDNIDALDKETCKRFVQMISRPEFMNFYEHIFLLGVNHKDIEDALGDVAVCHLS